MPFVGWDGDVVGHLIRLRNIVVAGDPKLTGRSGWLWGTARQTNMTQLTSIQNEFLCLLDRIAVCAENCILLGNGHQRAFCFTDEEWAMYLPNEGLTERWLGRIHDHYSDEYSWSVKWTWAPELKELLIEAEDYTMPMYPVEHAEDWFASASDELQIQPPNEVTAGP